MRAPLASHAMCLLLPVACAKEIGSAEPFSACAMPKPPVTAEAGAAPTRSSAAATSITLSVRILARGYLPALDGHLPAL